MLTNKRIIIAALLAAIALAVLASGVLAASGEAPAEQPSPFASVTVPTGPALSLGAITAIAAKEAARDGEQNPSMSVGEGTLAQAMATFSGDPAPESTDPGYQRLLDTPVDVVLMRGHFTLTDAIAPARTTIPAGDTMFVVIDSHRGDILGRGLPTPEAVAAAEAKSPAYAARTRAVAFHPVMGMVAGTFHVAGGPASLRKHITSEAGHAILVQQKGKTIKVTHTNSRGGFAVRLSPGGYSLKGTLGVCRDESVTVKANETVRVSLACSIL